MTRNWDSIEGFEGWSGVLDELVARARAAAQSGSLPARLAVQAELDEFIDRSPNSIARKLDETARQTMRDLFLETVEQRVAAIADRSADLRTYVKDVRSAAGGAARDAAAIRLERQTGAVDAINATIASIKTLRDALGRSAPDRQIAQAIGRTLAALQELRQSVELAPAKSMPQ